jgi:transmembrane sensor
VAVGALTLWPPRRVAGLEVVVASADLKIRALGGGEVEITEGITTLRDASTGTSIENVGPVSIRLEPMGVRVLRGRVQVRVVPRPRGSPPVMVQVSGGAIEVMGTRFTVDQRETAGSVRLEEGSIRFRDNGGRTVELGPGQTVAWPLGEPVPPPAPPIPPKGPDPVSPPRPEPRAARPPALEEVLSEVDLLRSRKQYEAAVRLLGQALQTQPAAAHERLSFELGSLLTHQLRDARRACAHWAAHRRRFPGGRYGEEVEQARASLACGGTP